MCSVPRLGLLQHALCCSLFLGLSINGAADTMSSIQGELGGIVTFSCTPSDLGKDVHMLYFQKPPPNPVFLNGYHSNENVMPPPEYLNRTRVNITQSSMEMWEINVMDEGEYECITVYKDDSQERARVFLNVTANYSRPVLSVTRGCNTRDWEDHSWECVVSCFSHGGYPGRGAEWTGSLPLIRAPGTVSTSQARDNASQLVNTSSILTFNCTARPQNLSCSVGGATSLEITVCKDQKKRQGVFDFWLLVSLGVVVVLLVLVLIPMLIGKRRRCKGGWVPSPQEDVPMADVSPSPSSPIP